MRLFGFLMEGFDAFVAERRKRLRAISRSTRGEYAYEDVVNEAWLVANLVAERCSMAADFHNDEFQERVLSWLYQHLVNYTEKKIRRIDQSPDEDDYAAVHPAISRLAADEMHDPLLQLMMSEAETLPVIEGNEHYSLASAWLLLLNHFPCNKTGWE